MMSDLSEDHCHSPQVEFFLMTTEVHNGDRPTLGIVLMLAGIAGFSVMDATIKWLAADYPVAQVVALRSWFGLPLLGFFALYGGGPKMLRSKRPLVHGQNLKLQF